MKSNSSFLPSGPTFFDEIPVTTELGIYMDGIALARGVYCTPYWPRMITGGDGTPVPVMISVPSGLLTIWAISVMELSGLLVVML
ncbi:hypothetical protein FCM35_KLT14105 [Carex littledalei]|uniref:Uncharacterized protein n=1 Tax=Carex littledalei TaxID=544730 RepID=A0A833QNH7_9POAL|nr:hypothetical protein FCM35_KLT14105 [Carex littledalei]